MPPSKWKIFHTKYELGVNDTSLTIVMNYLNKLSYKGEHKIQEQTRLNRYKCTIIKFVSLFNPCTSDTTAYVHHGYKRFKGVYPVITMNGDPFVTVDAMQAAHGKQKSRVCFKSFLPLLLNPNVEIRYLLIGCYMTVYA